MCKATGLKEQPKLDAIDSYSPVVMRLDQTHLQKSN
jgi:hypothetical protein